MILIYIIFFLIIKIDIRISRKGLKFHIAQIKVWSW